jgi:thioredoxin reductase (NADPH)
MSTIYDVIIIGGGPAGLTAGLYAGRAGLNVLILENPIKPSQLLITDYIENYPGFPSGISGFELMNNFKKQIEKFELETKKENVVSVEKCKSDEFDAWQVNTDKDKYKALSVIAATGADFRKLDVFGEKKFTGKGVSYCAICDGAFFKDKEIMVVGGGDTAVEEAVFLTRFAKKVTIVHRRNRLRAEKIIQDRALANEKIDFIWDSVITEISGDIKVSSVKVENVKTQEQTEVACEGVFIFVGYIPNVEYIKDLVDLDNNNYIITDNNTACSQSGIFACGDCRSKNLRQIVNACGEGAVSAYSARKYVEELKGIEYK